MEAQTPTAAATAGEMALKGVPALFLVCSGVCLARLWRPELLGGNFRPETLLLFLGLGTVLLGLTRELPLQNVLLAAVLVGFLSTVATAIGLGTGISVHAATWHENPGGDL